MMSNIDFENGFILGATMRGKVKSAGGAELNIAYGDTAPDDTSKLWIKASEPESIVFGGNFEGVESMSILDTVLPSAYSNMGATRIGNKIYLFGGYNTSNLQQIDVFDIETETIRRISSTALPIAISNMGCASVGNKIYLFGGNSKNGRVNQIQRFDAETETITTLNTTLPTKCSHMGCVSVGTKIYLFGGHDGSYTLGRIDVFDTETETITTLSATYGQYAFGCASVGTKIYLFGGYKSSRIVMFDMETQAISTLSATLSGTWQSPLCVNIGTKIYIFGTSLNIVDVFDTVTQSISTISITNDRGDLGGAGIGNKIYIFGGYGSSRVNTINKFIVSKDLTQNNIEVITTDKNFFNVVNTDTMKVETGVNSVLIGNAENQAENCEAYLYQNDAWVQI
jgi:hypothetical protein